MPCADPLTTETVPPVSWWGVGLLRGSKAGLLFAGSLCGKFCIGGLVRSLLAQRGHSGGKGGLCSPRLWPAPPETVAAERRALVFKQAHTAAEVGGHLLSLLPALCSQGTASSCHVAAVSLEMLAGFGRPSQRLQAGRRALANLLQPDPGLPLRAPQVSPPC